MALLGIIIDLLMASLCGDNCKVLMPSSGKLLLVIIQGAEADVVTDIIREA